MTSMIDGDWDVNDPFGTEPKTYMGGNNVIGNFIYAPKPVWHGKSPFTKLASSIDVLSTACTEYVKKAALPLPVVLTDWAVQPNAIELTATLYTKFAYLINITHEEATYKIDVASVNLHLDITDLYVAEHHLFKLIQNRIYNGTELLKKCIDDTGKDVAKKMHSVNTFGLPLVLTNINLDGLYYKTYLTGGSGVDWASQSLE